MCVCVSGQELGLHLLSREDAVQGQLPPSRPDRPRQAAVTRSTWFMLYLLALFLLCAYMMVGTGEFFEVPFMVGH